jgi:hypothetical protein
MAMTANRDVNIRPFIYASNNKDKDALRISRANSAPKVTPLD